MDKQEPVAWMWDVYSGAGYTSRGIDFYPTDIPFAKNIPLYTAPTKKEWVGLTDEELLDLADMAYANDLELLQTLQAKLKEKNT